MTQHPCRTLPSHCFWPAAIAETPLADVDPVVAPKFTITRADRVATAGSCFVQYIARHFPGGGFHYFVTKKALPRVWPSVAKDFGYGLFTADYGNIYTSRQLLQLQNVETTADSRLTTEPDALEQQRRDPADCIQNSGIVPALIGLMKECLP